MGINWGWFLGGDAELNMLTFRQSETWYPSLRLLADRPEC